MGNIRILLTGGGGAAAISFMDALAGDPAEIFVADIDPHAAGLYLVPASRRLLIPRGDDPAFAEAMLALCRQNGITLLVPTVDCELLPLARAGAEFMRHGTRVVVTPEAALELCLDKWKLLAACRGHIAIPRTELLDQTFSPSDWELPVVVKPRTGSGSRGVRVITAWSELETASMQGDLIIQEYLPGDEYSVDVLVDPATGSVVAAVPRSRLKVDSGIAVAGCTVHDAVLAESARTVAELVGVRFVANVQFRQDRHGRPALLEVNPRFPGTMTLTVASGINMPRLAIDAALGATLAGRSYPFRDLAMVRTWQEHYFSPDEFLSKAEESVA
jgi:carbamoyl-phosphate synthase large subunit